eukprot:7485211-Pyramimonas_sp.AAC.1
MVANDRELKLFVKLAWDLQGFSHRASKAKWTMQHLDEDERARVRDLSHQLCCDDFLETAQMDGVGKGIFQQRSEAGAPFLEAQGPAGSAGAHPAAATF